MGHPIKSGYGVSKLPLTNTSANTNVSGDSGFYIMQNELFNNFYWAIMQELARFDKNVMTLAKFQVLKKKIKFPIIEYSMLDNGIIVRSFN